MFFFTIWGGSDVKPKDPDNIVVTVWGATDIQLPTLAEKLIRLKQVKMAEGTVTDAVIRRTNVITLMGATIYKRPTVAREIEEMKQLKDSGSISATEMIELWQEAIRRDDLDQFEALTIMGGAGEESPSRREEIKDLDRLVARGIISPQERNEIQTLLEKNASPETGPIQQKLVQLMQPSAAYAPPSATIVNSAILE
jgi:hypothetical protein